MNQSELANPSRRRRARRVAALPPPHRATARVTVSWQPANHDRAAQLGLSEVELVAGLEAVPNRNWTCLDGSERDWVQAIASSRSSEVLLTARLGNDLAAKHLVLELAELLTFTLRESHPLVRVLFLPDGAPRRIRSDA